MVVSDWNAAHDTVGCALAGLDLEMPTGPVLGEALAAAVRAGDVPVAQLDDTVDRLVRLARRIHGHPTRRVVASPDAPGGRSREGEVLTRAAAAGFVLLKNERDLLPLRVDAGRGALAVIGPNAVDPCFQGGGSAWVNTGELRAPLDALVEQYAPVVEVRSEQGCRSRNSFLPLELLDARAAGPASRPGLTLTYESENAPATARGVEELRRRSFLSWHDGIDAFPDGTCGTVRMSAWLTPTRAGDHEFSVKGSGPASLRIDGRRVAALEAQGERRDVYAALFSPRAGVGTVTLPAGRAVHVEACMRHEPGGIPVLEVGCRAPEPEGLLDSAVALARQAQAVVLMVGTSADVEAESADRSTTTLPGDQDALVEAVLAVNPRTVVVVNAGAAVDLPWLERAAAVLYVWFPGHGFADALTGVLSGCLEPGGRLPLTLAATHDQYPAYETTPDADGRLVYAESVLVGYRHLDAHGLQPAFPFGHGLGYTHYAYGSPHVTAGPSLPEHPLVVSVAVTNVGQRFGKEVVQLYVSPPTGEVLRTPRELKAFEAVHLHSGETREVVFRLDARAFAHWDSDRHRWHVAAGTHQVSVGRSSWDLRGVLEVTLPEIAFTSTAGHAAPSS